MQRWAEGFDSTLAGFSLQTLEAEASPIYAISSRYELVYYNLAYRSFAERNQAVAVLERFPIGSDIRNAIGGPARKHHEERFSEVMQGSTPWFHEYTCSSSRRYREFRQGVYPFKHGAGLLLISSLTAEGALGDAPQHAAPPLRALYQQASGLITQCSNCRRTRRNDGSDVWDWVPDWVATPPPGTSHDICCICYEYHWKR